MYKVGRHVYIYIPAAVLEDLRAVDHIGELLLNKSERGDWFSSAAKGKEPCCGTNYWGRRIPSTLRSFSLICWMKINIKCIYDNIVTDIILYCLFVTLSRQRSPNRKTQRVWLSYCNVESQVRIHQRPLITFRCYVCFKNSILLIPFLGGHVKPLVPTVMNIYSMAFVFENASAIKYPGYRSNLGMIIYIFPFGLPGQMAVVPRIYSSTFW